MKTLALRGGDLVVGPAGHQTITGTPKIRQDLALALGEPYGNDRFHPTWGSVLPNYVGTPLTPDLEMMVRAEVARVIAQYIAIQQDEVVADSLGGVRSRYTTDDVISQVTAITATVNADTIRVAVSLTTRSQQQVTLTRTVSI
jgi:phage baseplate assembly protein W